MTRALLISLLSFLAFASCVKNEVEISLALPADLSTNYRVVYYASDARVGMIMELGLPVTNGAGKATLPMVNPCFLYISGGNYDSDEILVYAERGDKIKITGTDPNPLTWEVGGNKLNKEWCEWRRANLEALRSRDPRKVNAAVRKYVAAHKDAPLSALLLLTSFSRVEEPMEFAALWRSLPVEVREAPCVQALSRADMVEGVAPWLPLAEATLPAYEDTTCTLRPADYRASILYFWRSRISRNQVAEVFDSLRAIAPVKDTLGFAADINLDSDSINWVYSVRRDSLHTLRHLWAPASEMNPALRDMKIPQAPCYIVLNSKGEQAYRGSDMAAALAAYRRLLAH